MKILLDTCVLIDIITRRKPDNGLARNLIVMQQFGDIDIWISAQSLLDAAYVVQRRYPKEKLYDLLRGVLLWAHVAEVSQRQLQDAFLMRWDDFEDAVVFSCAQTIGADAILTRNQRDFLRSTIPVMEPSAFIDSMREEYGLTYATAKWSNGTLEFEEPEAVR